MMRPLIILFVGILLTLMLTATDGTSCIKKTGDKYSRIKCRFGQKCCGTLTTKRCSYTCFSHPIGSSKHVKTKGKTSTTVVIVGIVLGAFGLIALVTGIVVCCVCYMKSSRRPGQVLQTGQPMTIYQGSTNPAYKYSGEGNPPPYSVYGHPMSQYQPPDTWTGAVEEKKV